MAVTRLEGQKWVNLLSGAVIASCRRNGICSHVAVLAKDTNNVKNHDKLSVYQMGPPLTGSLVSADSEIENDPNRWALSDEEIDMPSDSMDVNAVACLGDLTEQERRRMKYWYKKVLDLFAETAHPSNRPNHRSYEEEKAGYYTSCHYIAHPPKREERDSGTGRIKNLWFSCAGFVTAYYESVAVKQLLVSFSDSSFPKIDQQTVRDTWGSNQPEVLRAIGLSDSDAWPLVMPGYVVNAFKREDETVRNIPFLPTANDIRVQN